MAAGTPLTRLTLGAASVADDLGYVALSDLARGRARAAGLHLQQPLVREDLSG
jgi:hypothetical protein